MFPNEGFTALAHPSPISVGCGHGVYILPPIENQSNCSSFMSECLRVLQKPSIEEMREKGAVTKFKSGLFLFLNVLFLKYINPGICAHGLYKFKKFIS